MKSGTTSVDGAMAKSNTIGRRGILGLAAGMGAMLATSATAKQGGAKQGGAKQSAAKPARALLRQGTFTVNVDDIHVHCEVRGTGPLIIMLNGMWLQTFADHLGMPLFKALAEHFTVLTFDPRGQGRTSLGSGPITYGRFAADTVGLMRELNIADAHFIGHSDGGVIQLDLLLDFPEKVRSATLIGTSFVQASYRPETQAFFTGWFEDMRHGRPFVPTEYDVKLMSDYRKVSPQPDKAMDMLVARRDCYSTEPNISLRELATIKRPVMVFEAGKDEYILPEQCRILAENIQGSRLVTMPDMTHDITPFVGKIAAEAAQFVKDHPQIG